MKSEEEKTGEPKAELRRLVVQTDGTITDVVEQTCSNMELHVIALGLLEMFKVRERAALVARRQQSPPPRPPEPKDEPKPYDPEK